MSGARECGIAENRDSLLRLNCDSPLGRKGAIIQLPKDKVIFSSVRATGQWSVEESVFLAEGLKTIASCNQHPIALIDIGANTGLITRQAMNLAKTGNDVILFEPLKRHAQAIEFNLSHLIKSNSITINNFALSDRDGTATFFSEKSNFGNSSLLAAVVPESDVEVNHVEMKETSQYFSEHLMHYKRCILKCDAQGFDALILCRIPSVVWDTIDRAIIEVWSVAEICENDVDKLISKLEPFPYISWSSTSFDRIHLAELKEFWLSKTSESRNLYLSRFRV
jgi:FkbM family methyltransferase